MNRVRRFWLGEFITSTVGPLSCGRGDVSLLPIVGVDECLNDKSHIEPMLHRLVGQGVVSSSQPLWHSIRETALGQRMSVMGGSLTPSPLVPDAGKPVKGFSWPDEAVVANLIVNFTHADRLCLLTANIKRDTDGLRHILEREVAPAIEALAPRRLGLLVLAQKPKSSLSDYTRAVEARLTKGIVAEGFKWEQVPAANGAQLKAVEGVCAKRVWDEFSSP